MGMLSKPDTPKQQYSPSMIKAFDPLSNTAGAVSSKKKGLASFLGQEGDITNLSTNTLLGV